MSISYGRDKNLWKYLSGDDNNKLKLTVHSAKRVNGFFHFQRLQPNNLGIGLAIEGKKVLLAD